MMQQAWERRRMLGACVAAVGALAGLCASDAMAVPPSPVQVRQPQVPRVVVIPPAPTNAPPRPTLRVAPRKVPPVDATVLARELRAVAGATPWQSKIQDLAFPLSVTWNSLSATVKPNPVPDYAGGKQQADLFVFSPSMIWSGAIQFYFPANSPQRADLMVHYSEFYSIGEPVLLDCAFFVDANGGAEGLNTVINFWNGTTVKVPFVSGHVLAKFTVPSITFQIEIALPRRADQALQMYFDSCTLSPVN